MNQRPLRPHRYAVGKQLAKIAALLAMLAAAAVPAAAHSYLVRSTPEAKERLKAPPERIHLRFGGGVEAKYSKISLMDREGRILAEGGNAVASGELVLQAPKLEPGQYQVRWRVLSVDGHVVKGHFDFTVSRQ